MDKLIERCQGTGDSTDTAKTLYEQAISYKTIVFEELIKELRFAIHYFREHCLEGRHIQELAIRPHGYTVELEAPYSVVLTLTCGNAFVDYTKQIRENPRADLQFESGRILVKTNFNQSFWLELKGKRLSTKKAAEFLLAEMFELLVSDSRSS